MKTMILLYLGVGVFLILVKCLIILYMNWIQKFYFTPNAVKEALLGFMIDIIAWPIDVWSIAKYISDSEFRDSIIENIEQDRRENGYD